MWINNNEVEDPIFTQPVFIEKVTNMLTKEILEFCNNEATKDRVDLLTDSVFNFRLLQMYGAVSELITPSKNMFTNRDIKFDVSSLIEDLKNFST